MIAMLMLATALPILPESPKIDGKVDQVLTMLGPKKLSSVSFSIKVEEGPKW